MATTPDHITITCPDCGQPIHLHEGTTATTAAGTTAITYDAAPMLQHIRDTHPAAPEEPTR